MSLQPLHGREREILVLDHLFNHVHEKGGILVGRGEAGICRSALLEGARAYLADREMQNIDARSSR